MGSHFGVGNTPDISYKIVFGDTPSLSAGVESDIWSNTNAQDTAASAETLSIVSSSVNDDTAGTGVDGVNIEGLDGDYNPVSEFIFLDGTTPVTTTAQFLFVYTVSCVAITSTGSTNAGNITVTNSSSGDNLGYIKAGDSISKQSQFIIPAGYNGILLSLHTAAYNASGSGAKRAKVDFNFEPQTGGAAGVRFRTLKISASSESGTSEDTFHVPLTVGEKVGIYPAATADANNTIVSCQYELILVKTTVDIDTVF
jgi:hypothetical protein